MADQTIPFNRPCLMGNEISYLQQAVDAGHCSGDGGFTRRCVELLERHLGAARVLLTTSCTHALEMSALLAGVGPGDDVILPSFTFVSTANAFVLQGARPVFADIRPDTLNLDENLLESLISERTRAVVPVHYAGVACEMDRILSLCQPRGIAVIEDNAHGLFGRYRGKPLGTFGELAAVSFHETKNITCGEGGALIVNDPRHTARAEILRDKGTNRRSFLRGEVDRYTWVDVGSSYVLSDLLAAFLLGQLEQHEAILRIRGAIWRRYLSGLDTWARRHGVRLPIVPTHCEQSYHLFYLLLPSLEARDGLLQHLRQRRILGVFHYVPLHSSPMGLRLGGRVGQCPVSEDVSARLVRLPLYNCLKRDEQDRVIEAVISFRP